jgi:hypothetical protein
VIGASGKSDGTEMENSRTIPMGNKIFIALPLPSFSKFSRPDPALVHLAGSGRLRLLVFSIRTYLIIMF